MEGSLHGTSFISFLPVYACYVIKNIFVSPVGAGFFFKSSFST